MDVHQDCSSCNAAHPTGHHKALQCYQFSFKRLRQQTLLLSQVPGELLQSNYPVDRYGFTQPTRITRKPVCTKLNTQPVDNPWTWPRHTPTSAGSIRNRNNLQGAWVGPGKPYSHMEIASQGTAFCMGEHTQSRTRTWKEPRVLLFLAGH